MKRIVWSFIFTMVVLCSLHTVPVHAAESAKVFCDSVQMSEGSTCKIPVQIEHNAGIMGFKIQITYPADRIELLGAERGSVTEQGNFSDNAGKKEGSMDILWNDVQDHTEDGSLFYLVVQLLHEETEDITLEMTYSQEDTFNEAWEDVRLICSDIVISSKDAAGVTEDNTAAESKTGTEDKAADSKAGTGDNTADSKAETEDKAADSKTETGDKAADSKTGTADKTAAESKTETGDKAVVTEEDAQTYLTQKAIREYIEAAECDLDASKITYAVEKVQQEYEIKNFDDAKNSKTKQAVDALLQALEKEGIENTIKDLPAEQKTEAVQQLYEAGRKAEKQEAQNTAGEHGKKRAAAGQAGGAAGIIVLLLAAAVLVARWIRKR